MYIPSIGLIAVAVMSITTLFAAKHRTFLTYSFFIIPVCFFSYKTFAQTKIWKNSFTLWENAYSVYPNSSVANNNLGSEYYKKNDIKKSLFHINHAIELDPNYPEPYISLSNILTQQGNFVAADQSLQKALDLSPRNKVALYNAGVLFTAQNDHTKAALNFEKILQIDPYFGNAYIDLSASYYQLNRNY